MSGKKYGENGQYGTKGIMIKTHKTPIKEMRPKPMEEYVDIKPEDVSLRPLTPHEQELVNECSKQELHKLRAISLFLIIVSATIFIINLLELINGKATIGETIKNAIFTILILAMAMFVRKLANNYKTIVGVKVGHLNGIYSEKLNPRGNNRVYYFDVVFTSDNTRLSKVICNNANMYYSMQKDDKILVIVYADKMNAYGIKLN